MGLALVILNLLNTAAPGIASLVTLVRNKDGTITVLQYLDAADAATDQGLKENMDWLAAHPKVIT